MYALALHKVFHSARITLPEIWVQTMLNNKKSKQGLGF